MRDIYREEDYNWVKELLQYPRTVEERLGFFEDTSQVSIPDDPIERVVFQDKAKKAIRKIAQNKGHILMVGKPGTGKSMLADMFKEVLDLSLGEYLRPKESIVAFPGKDSNHIRIVYEHPDKMDHIISNLNKDIETARESVDEFSLSEQIKSVRRVLIGLLCATGISAAAGFFFPAAFIATGLAGIGSIFMYMQENNHKAQEKIQRQAYGGKQRAVKHLLDMVPLVLHDPRKDKDLMARVSEPDARNMKGGIPPTAPFGHGTLRGACERSPPDRPHAGSGAHRFHHLCLRP